MIQDILFMSDGRDGGRILFLYYCKYHRSDSHGADRVAGLNGNK